MVVEGTTVARNTNVQRHPVAACRVGWLTLVPGGGRSSPSATEWSVAVDPMSRARVRRAVIAPETGSLGRGLKARSRNRVVARLSLTDERVA